jgi:hypothetical protein
MVDCQDLVVIDDERSRGRRRSSVLRSKLGKRLAKQEGRV